MERRGQTSEQRHTTISDIYKTELERHLFTPTPQAGWRNRRRLSPPDLVWLLKSIKRRLGYLPVTFWVSIAAAGALVDHWRRRGGRGMVDR